MLEFASLLSADDDSDITPAHTNENTPTKNQSSSRTTNINNKLGQSLLMSALASGNGFAAHSPFLNATMSSRFSLDENDENQLGTQNKRERHPTARKQLPTSPSKRQRTSPQQELPETQEPDQNTGTSSDCATNPTEKRQNALVWNSCSMCSMMQSKLVNAHNKMEKLEKELLDQKRKTYEYELKFKMSEMAHSKAVSEKSAELHAIGERMAAEMEKLSNRSSQDQQVLHMLKEQLAESKQERESTMKQIQTLQSHLEQSQSYYESVNKEYDSLKRLYFNAILLAIKLDQSQNMPVPNTAQVDSMFESCLVESIPLSHYPQWIIARYERLSSAKPKRTTTSNAASSSSTHRQRRSHHRSHRRRR
mmetsp:Transcript_16806/g.25103  ORF Transcript_16806/g.25103 Transcript_16806/m.25103 type:complete len:364 (-) Transcript_16806:48-1139(-)